MKISFLVYFVEDEEEVYPYGITSLADKRDFLQKGDVVKFQIATVKSTGKKRAVCVAAMRSYVRAKVDSVKGLVSYLPTIFGCRSDQRLQIL